MSRANVKSERLQLASAISTISAKQDAFMKAVDALESFKSHCLTNLDLEIIAKKQELENLTREFERERKDKEIETTQYLAEFRYKGALDIFSKIGEVAIEREVLVGLRKDVLRLKQERDGEISAARQKEKEHGERDMKAIMSNTELKHKAEVAEMTASVVQQKKEIATLQKTIENLQHELAEQRKLTKDVAEAGRPAPITLQSK